MCNPRPAMLLAGCLALTLMTQSRGQDTSKDADLFSLILISADLFDAKNTMTICDLNEDGFLDSAERARLPWRAEYADFDLNRDGKLTHMEVAIWHAKVRDDYDITQYDRNNARNLMRGHDRNGNGELDVGEIAKGWPPDPSEYDRDSDGTITLFEMSKQLAYKRTLRRELGIEAIDNMSSIQRMKRFDANKDNHLDRSEWAKAELPREARLHDDDGDKKLSQMELALLFSQHRRDTGLSKSDATKAKQLFQMGDFNRDGKITDKEMTTGPFGEQRQAASTYTKFDEDSDGVVTLAEIQSFIAADRKRIGYDDQHLAEAKRLLLRHDENRSKFIEHAELSPQHEPGKLSQDILSKADQNKDKKLSVEELAKHLAKESS